MNSLIIRWSVLVLAFLGIADATYLAQSELSGVLPVCTVEGINGCRTVAESSFAHLFGIPIGIYGIIFYVFIFVLSAIKLLFAHTNILRVLRILSLSGLIVSAVLFSIQVFVIDTFCLYCDISDVLVVFIFVIVWRGFFLKLAKSRFTKYNV